jgi:hypothetical protein
MIAALIRKLLLTELLEKILAKLERIHQRIRFPPIKATTYSASNRSMVFL